MAAEPGSALLAEAAGPGRVLAVNMAADPALQVWAGAGARLRVQDERASALAQAAANLGGRIAGPVHPGGAPPTPDCRPRLQGQAPDPQAASRSPLAAPDRRHDAPDPAPDLRAAVAPDCPFPPDADAALVNLHHLWGRQPLRDSILAALRGLRAGGRLLLCGANNRGIRSAADDLAALGGSAPRVLAYRKGHRLLEAVRSPGWAFPGPPPPPAAVSLQVAGCDLRLQPVAGVFAGGQFDAGTRLLIETMPPLQGAVLDLGCGSGAVGITVALRGGRAHVLATDDSLRAVRAAAANAAANNVQARCAFRHGDGLPQGLRFAAIAVNPPFHFGAASTTRVAEAWLRQAPAHLERGGRLYLVYNRFLPYLRVLEAAFGAGQASLLADRDGYRVAGAVRAR